MEKIIIVAIAENGVIGKDGDIPWHYPEDLKHFKEKTMGHPVIMGSSTYRSLPEDYRPLPGRKNIVLTRSGIETDESVSVANSLEEAYSIAEKDSKKAFIIGGSTIYEQTLEDADRMIITRVHKEFDGDTFFPDWNKENWEETGREDRDELSFLEYTRKDPSHSS